MQTFWNDGNRLQIRKNPDRDPERLRRGIRRQDAAGSLLLRDIHRVHWLTDRK
jgi:hypothetical protein